MRRIFGSLMADLAEKDEKVVLITGDIGFAIFDEYRERHPSRFLNLGICEQSIVGVAAGLAIEGFRPWVYTITPFLLERPFEQIKLDIDQQNLDVKLVGFADYPTLGPTHSPLDVEATVALFRNVKGYFPSDSSETKMMMMEAYNSESPCFFSLTSDKKLSSSITRNEFSPGATQ